MHSQNLHLLFAAACNIFLLEKLACVGISINNLLTRYPFLCCKRILQTVLLTICSRLCVANCMLLLVANCKLHWWCCKVFVAKSLFHVMLCLDLIRGWAQPQMVMRSVTLLLMVNAYVYIKPQGFVIQPMTICCR